MKRQRLSISQRAVRRSGFFSTANRLISSDRFAAAAVQTSRRGCSRAHLPLPASGERELWFRPSIHPDRQDRTVSAEGDRLDGDAALAVIGAVAGLPFPAVIGDVPAAVLRIAQ